MHNLQQDYEVNFFNLEKKDKLRNDQTVKNFIFRLIHKKLPLNERLSRLQENNPFLFNTQDKISPLCPACKGSNETNDHLMKCRILKPNLSSEIWELAKKHLKQPLLLQGSKQQALVAGLTPKNLTSICKEEHIAKFQTNIMRQMYARWKNRCQYQFL